VTRVIVEAGQILPINVTDHIIVGHNRHCSFREPPKPPPLLTSAPHRANSSTSTSRNSGRFHQPGIRATGDRTVRNPRGSGSASRSEWRPKLI